ncbi:hypothetical protein S83_008840 [Arachis hypogaea]
MVSDLAPDLAPQATSTLVVRAHRSQLSRPLISASCMWPPLRSRTSHPCQPPTLATLRLCGSFAKSQFFVCSDVILVCFFVNLLVNDGSLCQIMAWRFINGPLVFLSIRLEAY